MGSVIPISTHGRPAPPVCEVTVHGIGFQVFQDPQSGRYYVYAIGPRGAAAAGAHREGIRLLSKVYDLVEDVVR